MVDRAIIYLNNSDEVAESYLDVNQADGWEYRSAYWLRVDSAW
jgi:hypothetical protein